MSIVVESSVLESITRRLAAFEAREAPVTTVYLDVDGRRHSRRPDVERHLDALLRRSRDVRGIADRHPSVTADLERIADWVRTDLDRSRTRGVVFVSCTAQELFEVVELPLPVPDRVIVNHLPAMGPLEALVQEQEPVGVVLVDRSRAQLLVVELGEVAERIALVDSPAQGDPGHGDRGDLAAAEAAATHGHLRRVADAAWSLFGQRPFSHLSLGGTDAVLGELEGLLHPYLSERLVERLALAPSADPTELRDAVLELSERIERRREAATVARLRQAAASGGRGVVGLAETLGAVNERRVAELVVSAGYAEEGWRSPATGELAVLGPVSSATGERLDRVDDVVEDAIDTVIAQGCRVEICIDNADLDVVGRIGALLRY